MTHANLPAAMSDCGETVRSIAVASRISRSENMPNLFVNSRALVPEYAGSESGAMVCTPSLVSSANKLRGYVPVGIADTSGTDDAGRVGRMTLEGLSSLLPNVVMATETKSTTKADKAMTKDAFRRRRLRRTCRTMWGALSLATTGVRKAALRRILSSSSVGMSPSEPNAWVKLIYFQGGQGAIQLALHRPYRSVKVFSDFREW